MSESDSRYCRVLLTQARAFRLRGSPFAFTLLEWAGNARRRAMRPASTDCGQMEMPM